MLPIFPDPGDPFGADIGADPSASFPVVIPTRPEVRAAVARYSERLRAMRDRGENYHQASLDNQDAVNRFAHALSVTHGPEASTAFLLMWAEELDALTQQMLQQTAASEHATDAGGQIIGGIIVVLVFGFILYLIVSG